MRGGGSFVVEPDRRAAIHRPAAPRHAPATWSIMAGKGHEAGRSSQDGTVPFDDRDVVREELAACGGGVAGMNAGRRDAPM